MPKQAPVEPTECFIWFLGSAVGQKNRGSFPFGGGIVTRAQWGSNTNNQSTGISLVRVLEWQLG
jgi:hypothetical protein